MTRPTPAARALVGCLALSDRLAGYDVKSASPVWFYRGRCHALGSGSRVVVRNGRVVRVSGSATALSSWMLRLGRKLAFLSERAGRRAA